jgi:hypothetical protein
MGQEIDWEIRERAEELYIVDARTFEQVAAETGVSVSQLKNWSADGGWRQKREEYRAARQSIRSTMMNLRQKMASEAAASADPQKVFAFIRLEALADKKERKTDTAAAKIDKPALFMESVEFIASYLKDTDPEGLKILARNFDGLIESFKAKHAQAT